jgi:hypothetical protein
MMDLKSSMIIFTTASPCLSSIVGEKKYLKQIAVLNLGMACSMELHKQLALIFIYAPALALMVKHLSKMVQFLLYAKFNQT